MSSSFSEPTWLYNAAIFIYSSTIVRFITLTCLLIGSVSILPLVIFLTIDIILWCWRMFWHRSVNESAQPPDTLPNLKATTTSITTHGNTSGARATRRR
ncbi:hypothetical protein MY11210_003782 [Beauveria gryllotalpidicola]